MPDETSSEAAAQAATPSAPQAGGSSTDDSATESSAATQAVESVSLETKKKLDKENLQLRRERDDLAKKLKAREDAELSETDRLQKRAKELEDSNTALRSQIRDRDARDAVTIAARKLGALDPSAAYRLVRDELEFDEKTGEILDVEKALKKAKAEFPTLFGRAAGSADGGSGSRQGAAADMNAWLRGGRA
jgi:hypothetical protein